MQNQERSVLCSRHPIPFDILLFLTRSWPFHLPHPFLSFPFPPPLPCSFFSAPPSFTICHDRQCFLRCSSSPSSPHSASLGIPNTILFSLAFLMVLSLSAASILEGGSSSRYVTVHMHLSSHYIPSFYSPPSSSRG